ncbi:hypothetical protein [Aneurinibacillus migulanus]|uniref:hypothetical protein n=1 Tax=Aneurinibacillus migulanus TaxID=47500 RepID=UPI00209FED8C|nr:hypothetical protein [Aneurinibacillus migulanus]MCP1355085.1 hypothetical protein [Aneurinibacillus migulanus]
MTEADILAETYWHRMEIRGTMEVKKPWGETVIEDDVLKGMDIPCSFSVGIGRNTTQTEGPNDIAYDGKVFCRPDVSVVTGDSITVTLENGWIRKFVANEPMYYPSHIEIPVTREGAA